MAQVLEPRFRFRVIADELQPAVRGWSRVAGIEQLSLKQSPLGAVGLREVLRSTPHDLLILNSIFDRQLTIPALMLRRLKLVPRKPVLLAPRGEFTPGALSLKSGKKRLHLRALKTLGLLDGVVLQATSEEEKEKIAAGFPSAGKVLVGPNVRPIPLLPPHSGQAPEESLKIAFLGRITPIKNLHFALETLSKVRCPVRFDIFGPPDDPDYWQSCLELAGNMPAHIEVRHRGVVSQAAVIETMARYDLLFLPTLGENFGHAIFEALSAGTPVLLSDQTPWRHLERHSAGWDISLERREAFVEAVERCSKWTEAERAAHRAGARRLAELSLSPAQAGAQLADCLEAAMSLSPNRG